MKIKNTIFILLIISLFSVILCSCSRDEMRTGTADAKRGIDNAIRNGENVVDYGMGALENGVNDITGDRYYRGGRGMNDGFGANSGYSAYVGNGTGTTASRKTNKYLPTIGDTSRDNMGQVNTTNGSSDGGMGDIYDDMNMSRNSLRTDKLDRKYVK